jgi:sulfur carrier protein ThiS
VLNLDRVTAELEQVGEALADYQFDELSVDVEDPGALVHLLEEVGIEDEEAGVSVSASPALERERLEARLEELGVLEACTETEETRKGYVSIRKVG